jgi:hypothetical protein
MDRPSDSGNSSQDNGGDRLASLMMAAIPRRSLPPRPPEGALAAAERTPALGASSSANNNAFTPNSLENMAIPRRKKIPARPTESSSSIGMDRLHGSHGNLHRRLSGTGSSSHQPSSLIKKPKHVSIQSEFPFVVKIRMRGVPMDMGIPRQVPMDTDIPRHRASTRTPKRARPSYEELQDTDSDDLVDSDNDADYASRPKKLRRGSHGSSQRAHDLNKVTAAASGLVRASSAAGSEVSAPLDPGSGGVALAPKDGALIDSPPPGTLNTLWYSRECYLHIFVVEKIVGWKRRPVASLNWEDPNALKFLDPAEASSISQKALSNPVFWNVPRRRMELSRINVTQCPIVMAVAAEREKETARNNGSNPKYALNVSAEEWEEVLLVKWRGRSHLHCSWERPTDIQKLDPSNSTARHKIRRYYQSQEVALGKDWKKLLEEERATAAAIHSHGEAVNVDSISDQADGAEEFFAPQCLEVERILACDENEMDMQVLAKQRALNIRTEQEALKLREEAEDRIGIDGPHKAKNNPLMVKDLVDMNKTEEPWDPEDNVRYVVKWKGLPFAEITWEYWRDIKRDAVDEAEDFWHRQKPPSMEEVKQALSKPHPHVKDFRKLPESKTYGISSRTRPVADLGGGSTMVTEEDDIEAKPGFQLRGYQLEGVNWLLFNWWNRRSCILADEVNASGLDQRSYPPFVYVLAHSGLFLLACRWDLVKLSKL